MRNGLIAAVLVLSAFCATVAFGEEVVAGNSSTPPASSPAATHEVAPPAATTPAATAPAPGAPATAAAEEGGGCCACPPDPKVTGDVYINAQAKYLFRGQDLSGNKPVVQGGIDLNYKAWTLSTWTNWQMENTDTLKNITENDLYLNYAYTPIELLTLNMGDSLYVYNNSTTNELYLKANLNTLLTPTFSVYWDWDKATHAGLYYALSVSHKQVIERNVASITLGALASYNMRNPNTAVDPNSSNSFDGAYNGFHNYELSASLDWTPTTFLTVTPYYTFSDALSDKARNIGGIEAQHIGGLKVTAAF